jgi:hypothetical protein
VADSEVGDQAFHNTAIESLANLESGTRSEKTLEQNRLQDWGHDIFDTIGNAAGPTSSARCSEGRTELFPTTPVPWFAINVHCAFPGQAKHIKVPCQPSGELHFTHADIFRVDMGNHEQARLPVSVGGSGMLDEAHFSTR